MAAKPKIRPVANDAMIALLRAMPVRHRVETIIGMFQLAASEFAQLVLEHTTPDVPPRRRAAKKKKR